MSDIRELTKAEDQLMRVLWQLKKAVIKDIQENMPDPKPAYNTIATVLKVLKSKGFVDHETNGSMYQYYPVIDEHEYTRFAFGKVFTNYFNGSYSRLVSFLVKEKAFDEQTRAELLNIADKLKDK